MGGGNRSVPAFPEVSLNEAKHLGEDIMNMPSKKSIISLAIGSAVAATLGTASIASAGENPFAAQSLEKGYMVAESHYDKDQYGDKKDGYGDKKDGYGDKKGDKKYGEGRCGMSMADTDNDGRVSRDEHARHAETMFDKMDANRDGYIDKDEANKMKRKHGHGHGHGHRSKYGSGDRGYDDDGVSIKRDREYGAGEQVDRDLPHMRPMGQ
jgi:uncharacterized low-complexity protein